MTPNYAEMRAEELATQLTAARARAAAAELDSKIQRGIAQQLAGYVGRLEHDLRLLPWEQLSVLLAAGVVDADAVNAFNRLWNTAKMLGKVQP